MESLDELEHPLLDDSPTHSSRTGNSSFFKGIFVRCEEEKRLPSLAWRSFSGPTDVSQQQQPLDPCSLPSTLESFYNPSAPVWGPAESLGLHSKEYLETTFMDMGPGSPLERKLLSVSRDVHSVSYSMEDEDDMLPDFEVRLKCPFFSLSLWTSLSFNYLSIGIVIKPLHCLHLHSENSVGGENNSSLDCTPASFFRIQNWIYWFFFSSLKMNRWPRNLSQAASMGLWYDNMRDDTGLLTNCHRNNNVDLLTKK